VVDLTLYALAGGAAAFAGKLVIDPTNPIGGFSPESGVEFSIGHSTSAGEKIQAWLPDAKVVKCWNCIGNKFMIDPPADKNGARPDMWIAGNDAEALGKTKALLGHLGFPEEHVIVGKGGIKASRWLEPLCQAWVNYGVATGSWNHGFAMLQFPSGK